MPHSSAHVVSVIIRRTHVHKVLFILVTRLKKKKRSYHCFNSSWSSGHVSAAGMCSLLMAEQGNAAKTTRLLQRAKSGCGWSRVSPQRGFMVGSGFWTGPSEHGRGGETGSVHTADTKLLLIPEVFVGWQTHLMSQRWLNHNTKSSM